MCAEHDDTGQALTVFTCVLVQYPQIAHHSDSAKHDDTGQALTQCMFILFYQKDSAEHDDTGHTLTSFMFILVHRPQI